MMNLLRSCFLMALIGAVGARRRLDRSASKAEKRENSRYGLFAEYAFPVLTLAFALVYVCYKCFAKRRRKRYATSKVAPLTVAPVDHEKDQRHRHTMMVALQQPVLSVDTSAAGSLDLDVPRLRVLSCLDDKVLAGGKIETYETVRTLARRKLEMLGHPTFNHDKYDKITDNVLKDRLLEIERSVDLAPEQAQTAARTLLKMFRMKKLKRLLEESMKVDVERQESMRVDVASDGDAEQTSEAEPTPRRGTQTEDHQRKRMNGSSSSSSSSLLPSDSEEEKRPTLFEKQSPSNRRLQLPALSTTKKKGQSSRHNKSWLPPSNGDDGTEEVKKQIEDDAPPSPDCLSSDSG